MEDLQGISRSYTIILDEFILDELPNLGSPKANYYQNMSVVRRNLREGVTFKDAFYFDERGNRDNEKFFFSESDDCNYIYEHFRKQKEIEKKI